MDKGPGPGNPCAISAGAMKSASIAAANTPILACFTVHLQNSWHEGVAARAPVVFTGAWGGCRRASEAPRAVLALTLQLSRCRRSLFAIQHEKEETATRSPPQGWS